MIRGHLYLGKRMASILKIPAGADRDGAKARLRAELGNELSEAKAKVVKLETDLERAKRRAEGEVSVVELCEGGSTGSPRRTPICKRPRVTWRNWRGTLHFLRSRSLSQPRSNGNHDHGGGGPVFLGRDT